MAKDKGPVYSEFRDKKNVIVMGLLCGLYFLLMVTSNLGALAQILPPLPENAFILVALLVLGAQVFVWRRLKLFRPRWYLDIFALLLLLCEYLLLFFVALFLSWPFYLLGDYWYDQAHKVY